MSRATPILADRSRHEIRNSDGNLPVFWAHRLVRWAFMFILATAARRYNVGIVAYAMMPNHIHIIVRLGLDPSIPHDLPEFRKFVRSNMALFLNAHWGLKGKRFCGDSVGDSIKIVDEASEMDQLLYVELNGVNAGLGKRPEEFDGAFSQRAWLTAPREVLRPPFWFQKRTWAASESLQLCVPTLFAESHSAKEFQELSTNQLNSRLRRIHRERKKAGLTYRTLESVEEETPDFSSPTNSQADHSVAHLVGEDREAKAVEYHNLRAWQAWYGSAVRRLRRGDTNVVFPPGTYKLAKEAGVTVAPDACYSAKVRRRNRGQLQSVFRREIREDSVRITQRE